MSLCFLLYLSVSFYPCCARCVFCVLFCIPKHLYVSCSFFYKFNRHLCHGAYWCTHNPAHMPIPLFRLHLPFSNFLPGCVCVSKHTYAFPSSSIFIHTYRHIHMYGLCSALYSYPSLCFLSSASTNLIDTYVTVPVDVRTTLLISLSSSCICVLIPLIYDRINQYDYLWKKKYIVPVTLQIHDEC